jgi:hypothetical protein
MKSRPPDRPPKGGKERARAGLDTSLQRHGSVSLKASQIPTHTRPGSSLFESCPARSIARRESDNEIPTNRAWLMFRSLGEEALVQTLTPA